MELFVDKIFSVSEFIALLNIGLKSSKAKIIGEVGEAKAGPTGHVYFTLKDENDQSIMKCIIWKSRYNLYDIKLQEGMKIMAYGYPEIYPPSGRLSFIAETIELAGEGGLKKQYDELKKKLEKEGIFAEEKKRPVPRYPQRIGVITSKQGAVMADFLNNIGKFGFKIKMIDSRVEGQTATRDLLASIKTFRKQDIDVLVIIRGGGSLESLMPFNNELLVREVANFPVPVIAGIGHDKDEPLVALAADVSESTPTAAANLLNESWEQALLFLERYERNIIDRYEMILDNYKAIENELKISLRNFKNALLNAKISLRDSLNKSLSGFRSLLLAVNQKLGQAEKAVFFNNPERQIRLGYSIASCDGKIVRRTGDVKIGKNIDIKVIDGKIISEVKNINKN
ncbi:MAG TPA: exodeoxyribonuclease VII large subunit [Candidatus Nealsonbacteria bacterium]|uniref:Exonuclease VII large subunit C-terminal domain-containing protein n=1 Tax=marine sediment metagenome TaxID=412755 RepID=A0A0F9VFP2_9ZZZZ|nr:exodeoxyribonuclease VII large subunit [Candidatus Nealsonbacteria bacterium]HEB46557.1 exodeoxyribonuclease VII large subunit [Candidatus Nealsonbacteria bacterium]